MHIDDIKIHYITKDGIEWAYVYWNIHKVWLPKEHYSEEELKQRFFRKLHDDDAKMANYATANAVYKKTEEI